MKHKVTPTTQAVPIFRKVEKLWTKPNAHSKIIEFFTSVAPCPDFCRLANELDLQHATIDDYLALLIRCQDEVCKNYKLLFLTTPFPNIDFWCVCFSAKLVFVHFNASVFGI